MKRGIIYRISLTRLLIVSYVSLSVFVIFFAYLQYHQIGSGRAYINDISRMSTKKLKLLTNMSEVIGSAQASLLQHVYTSDRHHTTAYSKVFSAQSTKYNSELAAYEKLKKNREEQRIFEELLAVNNDNNRATDSLVDLADAGIKVSERQMQLSIARQQNTYEKLQQANARLSNLIGKQSENETAAINKYSFEILKGLEVSFCIVVFLLAVLALAIGNVVRKITETHIALTQSKNIYSRFVQNTGEIIIRSNGMGRIMFANRAFKEKMGYSDAEIEKLSITDLFAEETKSEYGGNSLLFKQDEQITSINVIYKTKAGKQIYLEGNVVLNYTDGRLETAESFLRDITQRKQLHDELLASENKYRALFELSPLPEYFVDTGTMEFVEVNPAAVRKYGYSREEFLKMTIYDIRKIEADEMQHFHFWMGQFCKEDVIYGTKTRHYKKNGQALDIELRFKRIVLMNRQLFVAIAIDVTKKQRHEREINQAILKAQENERQEMGTELHDNICQILASSHLLLDSIKRTDSLEGRTLIEKSKQQIKQALYEIRNLSHRLAPIFFEASSFEQAINDLLQNMNPDNKYDLRFDFDQKIVSELVSSDIQLNLYRILQEQMKNIIKYAKAMSIHIGLSLENNVIRMFIKDDGIGFDAVKVKKGIGIINMQRRAELFSGKFFVETSPGKGCCIIIELPVSDNYLSKN